MGNALKGLKNVAPMLAYLLIKYRTIELVIIGVILSTVMIDIIGIVMGAANRKALLVMENVMMIIQNVMGDVLAIPT